MNTEVDPTKRILTEVYHLSQNSDVQSYFQYECSGTDVNSCDFRIYGYLLPRSEPYKHGSYKVCITLPAEFPLKSPDIQLLTYIYHPAIKGDASGPHISIKLKHNEWNPKKTIGEWLKTFVDMIDQPRVNNDDYEILNQQAMDLYLHNRSKYNKMAMKMTSKHAHQRSGKAGLSLWSVILKTIIYS